MLNFENEEQILWKFEIAIVVIKFWLDNEDQNVNVYFELISIRVSFV